MRLLSYEAFTADPARELAAVCAFLGEPFDLARFGYASAVR